MRSEKNKLGEKKIFRLRTIRLPTDMERRSGVDRARGGLTDNACEYFIFGILSVSVYFFGPLQFVFNFVLEILLLLFFWQALLIHLSFSMTRHRKG